MDPIRLDYTHALADSIGKEHGLTDTELSALIEPAERALAAVQARRTKDLCWMDLPYQDQVREAVQSYAASVKGRFDNVVVLGIGGSALGNRAVHSAINGPFYDLAPPDGLPRLFILDNVDPELVGDFLAHVDVERTLFNVISKSGSTAETMSQFLIFRELLIDKLGAAAAREHIVVTTDGEAGVLRPIVEEEGYVSFVVPEGVGGRFSVLSPVGLLSSALIGVDIEALLAGAAAMDERCKNMDVASNPAAVYAALQWGMQELKGKNVAVTFPYSHRLRHMADWYAQLLGESIGKRKGRDGRDRFAGPTPVRAVGVTDQHSQVQLYIEGPFDKWFTFLAVDEPAHAVRIPEAFGDRDALAYLGGRQMGELFKAEREGTRIALTAAKRPNVTIHFPRVDAASLGQYFYLMEMAVALMGEYYGVDAFDQPGVEAGKIAAYALMGRAGYEEQRAAIEASQGGPSRCV